MTGFQTAEGSYLTLLSTDFSLLGGLVMALLVLTTLPWCCSLPALLYLLLLGFAVPYLRKIYKKQTNKQTKITHNNDTDLGMSYQLINIYNC